MGSFGENGQRVNQLSVIQRFDHPAGTRAANTAQDALIATTEVRGQLTRAELSYRVRSTYYRLQQQEALLSLYNQLVGTYAEYARTAVVRVEVGEANRLETLNLNSALRRYEQLAQRTQLAVTNLQSQLGLLLNTDSAVAPQRHPPADGPAP